MDPIPPATLLLRSETHVRAGQWFRCLALSKDLLAAFYSPLLNRQVVCHRIMARSPLGLFETRIEENQIVC